MIGKTPISIEEVISRAKVRLKIGNTSEYDDYLEMSISEGLRHLDMLTLYVKKQTILEIQDSKAQLPCDFMKLLGMRILKTVLTTSFINGKMVSNVPIPICSPIFYVDKTFLNDCACNNIDGNNILQNFRDTMQIVNGYISFNSNSIDEGKVSIAYMGLNVDQQGKILIYPEYERALTYYAMSQFQEDILMDNRSIALADRNYQKFVAQKAWLKAGAWKDEFQRTKMEIASMVNALVQDMSVTWI